MRVGPNEGTGSFPAAGGAFRGAGVSLFDAAHLQRLTSPAASRRSPHLPLQ